MQLDTIPLQAEQPTGLTLTEHELVAEAVAALANSINIATGGGVGAAVVTKSGQCLQLLNDVQTFTRTRITVYSVDAVRGVAHRGPLDLLLPYPFASRKLDQAAAGVG